MKNPTDKKGVLLLHPGMQLLGPLGGQWPKVRSLGFTKFCVRARLCGRVFLRGMWAPILSPGALFSFLTIPLFILFVYLLSGVKGVDEKIRILVASALAIILTLPVWALINALLAPFQARAAERKLGKWQGDRFVFNERQHVLTEEWSPDRNGQSKEFVVPNAAPYSLVQYRIEIDGPAERLSCLIVGDYYISPVEEVLKLWRPALYGRARLKKGRTLQLYCHSLPHTIPAIVRVYVVAWELAPDVLLEYADLRTDTRIVLAPPTEREAA